LQAAVTALITVVMSGRTSLVCSHALRASALAIFLG
jgi:hypothetical protein